MAHMVLTTNHEEASPESPNKTRIPQQTRRPQR